MQACIWAEALNYVVINNFLFRIDTRKEKDQDKENSFLLVIPEKYKPIIFHTYHDSLLAGHQESYGTAMTIRQRFFIAVHIDSLVMISIKKSETNKKRALEIQDKFVLDHGQC